MPAPNLSGARPEPGAGAPARFDIGAIAQSALRARITERYRTEEAPWVLALAREAELAPHQLEQAQKVARELSSTVRATRRKASGVEALVHEFSLSTTEGVALMCLAEALLRIPDAHTRDRLIRDKIGKGNWGTHLGAGRHLFANAAAWGLLIAGKLVATHSEGSLGAGLANLLRRGGEPLVRKAVDLAMRLLGRQFVTGETISEALANGRDREARGYRFSYDMLGEAAATAADARRYFEAYETAIRAIGSESRGRGIHAGPGISVKLSALHPRFSRQQRARVFAELLPRLKALLLLAREFDIGCNIDAEEADRLDLTLDLLEALATDADFAGWNGIGLALQAYQKRAPCVADWLIDLARRSGHRLMVRLVKGAYWDSEIKRAQIDGLADYPVFTRKVHTDVCYFACARRLLAAPDAIYPQFATHNAFTIAAIHALAGPADYEFQCLHGMGESIYDEVMGGDKLGVPCRIYAPVGSHETLLPYLVRRLLENGANSSFVHQIVDPAVSICELIADPVSLARQGRGLPHPAIVRPPELFTERRNSAGRDFSDESVLSGLAQSLASTPGVFHARPATAFATEAAGRPSVSIRNPACGDDVVGTVIEASAEEVDRAITAAVAATAHWAATAAATRAGCLKRWADLLEGQYPVVFALAVREAGKTLPGAVAELREAVDYCRYYAAQACAEFAGTKLEPLGPVVCISPWNFPLAIFAGQIAAALAAGNPVLAKPAEQTPLMAAFAVELAHRAGIPAEALQLLPGKGETVGARLVGDARIQGVLFTGSTEVARSISRTLAGRSDAPVLIAETGGLNAMIVDSSALPEQVVADVIASAFDSAGQRCSALRILCLQEEIADRVLAMLRGAIRELAVGDPAKLATDIGPVVDAQARAAIEDHAERMARAGLPVFRLPLADDCSDGTFVAPTLIELEHIEQIDREIFGPVLHVVRFRADELPRLVDALNRAGYGLTHGIHSRIDETVAAILERVRAGNVYVNRNMIGAVVGVQPFGGQGLSGTGPKAGGPFYLYRLLRDAEPPALGQWFDAAAPTSPAMVKLRGPTGEDNVLELRPRGEIACIAATRAGLLAQLAAVAATGNRPIVAVDQGDGLMAEAPGVLLAEDPLAGSIDGVLADLPPDRLRQLREKVAARPGAIVPVITPASGHRYPAWRLFAERSISTNTAAAGGNAALMMLP